MISSTGIELRPSGSLGIVSTDVLAGVQPGISRVQPLTRLVQAGIFPQLNLINTALFKSTDLPNIPSHLSASFTFDAGKKICLRQHASFWTTQSYTTNSLGDGSTPYSPYKLFMASVSMPMMHQQTAILMSFNHTAAALVNSSDSGYSVPRTGPGWIDNIRGNTQNYANFIITGSDGAGIIGRGIIGDEKIQVSDRVTPTATPDENGFCTTRPIDKPVGSNPYTNTYSDVLKDQVIAASRNIYGYGNTSNGGLSSYKFYSSIQRSERAIPYATWHDEPIGLALYDTAEQENYRNFVEAATTDTTCLKPCKLEFSESLRSDTPLLTAGTYITAYPFAGNSIDWVHRIESMRIYGISRAENILSNPASPTPV